MTDSPGQGLNGSGKIIIVCLKNDNKILKIQDHTLKVVDPILDPIEYIFFSFL